MKPRDLANLLNRAAAVIENPDSEIRSERLRLAADLAREADSIGADGESVPTP
jgi:hypothetical protein